MAAAVPRIQGWRENQESEDWIAGAALVVVEVMATTSAAAAGCKREDGNTLGEVEMAAAVVSLVVSLAAAFWVQNGCFDG